MRREIESSALHVEASQFWRGTVACTGTEFCKLAITETKSFARWVVEELEGRVPGFDQQLKLNITGCPNSCGQHWIADLGLEGKKIKVDGQFADAYYFCVGGSVGRVQSVARPVGYRCLATEVPESIARLLSRYTQLRDDGESLQQFLARKSNDESEVSLRRFTWGRTRGCGARYPDRSPAARGGRLIGGQMAALFPMFLKLHDRKCVVVGAGRVASQKLESLLDSGADVQVIAPTASSEIQQLAQRGRLTWIPAEFDPGHLQGALLVIAATGNPAVNEAVYRAARQRGVLCNSVDEPVRCDFYYPALVRRGDLQIAISTAGKSPALAQRIRKELEGQFDSNYIAWLNWLGAVRELFFKRQIDPELRRQALHRIAGRTVFERFKSSHRQKAQGGNRDDA